METNAISYYIGSFLGVVFMLALLALPIVLVIIAIRNYITLRREVHSYRNMVEAEDMEAARQRALDELEEARLKEEEQEAAEAASRLISITCPQCGTVNRVLAGYSTDCVQCGTRIGGTASAAKEDGTDA